MFVKTSALYKPDDCSETEWETLTPQEKSDRSNAEPFVFSVQDVMGYNGNNTGGTTVRFRNGLTMMIVNTVEELDSIFTPFKFK